MTDYQQIIDGLRLRLADEGQCELDGDLRRLAEEYAEACRTVNARLRRCGEFLRRNLRSEAIQLAESEPRLLDLVALLDFPEREQWGEVASIYELPAGDGLLLDVAAELNEAYAAEQPLQAVLAEHRLLALARAPLPQRIAALRRLDFLDAGNPLWDEDLRTFEEARLREVAIEAEEAARARDVESLEVLKEELAEPGWRIELPAETIDRVKRLLATRRRQSARERLAEVAVELNEAFGELNIARGRQLREEWRSLSRAAALPENDSLHEDVAPVLGWLDDEDGRASQDAAWQQALANIERALARQQVTVRELERLENEAVRHHRAIPEPLATRLGHRLEAARAVDRRRRVMIIGSSVCGLLLAIGLIGWGILAVRANAEVARLSKAVEGYLADGRIPEARRVFDEHRDASTAAGWLELGGRIAAAESAERERSSEFAAQVRTAQETQQHLTAIAALDRARELALTSDEKVEVVRLERSWQERQQRIVAERESEFRSRLDELNRDVGRLDVSMGGEPDAESLAEAAKSAADIRNRFTALRESAAGMRPELRSQTQLIENRFTGLDERRKSAQRRHDLMTRLDSLATFDAERGDPLRDLQQFAEALTEYADAFPDEPRSEHFREVADEAPLWQGVVAWRRSSAKFTPFLPRNPEEAAARLEECDAHLETYGVAPFAAEARQYRDLVETVASRESGGAGGDSLKEQFPRMVAGDLFRDVHVLEDRDGNIYYLKEEQDFATEQVANFKHLVGYGGQVRPKTLRTVELKSPKTRPAPQAALAERLRTGIDGLSVDHWESPCRSMVEDILAASDVDPLLRYQLLSQTLNLAAKGSPPLGLRLAAARANFEDTEIDLTARWMDPTNTAASTNRKLAERALLRTDGLTDGWDDLEEEYAALQGKLFPEIRFVGWLLRDRDRRWNCRSVAPTTASHRLYVATADERGEGRLAPVGSIEGGMVLLPSNLQGACREGRPVMALAAHAGE